MFLKESKYFCNSLKYAKQLAEKLIYKATRLRDLKIYFGRTEKAASGNCDFWGCDGLTTKIWRLKDEAKS